jgi:hypothetical protein
MAIIRVPSHSYSQSSSSSPTTRLNSPVLSVTSVICRLTAVAAISNSFDPIGRPPNKTSAHYIYRDHLQAPAAGVAQLRLSDAQKEAEKTRIIADAFAMHEASFAGRFSVIDQDHVRFRSLP